MEKCGKILEKYWILGALISHGEALMLCRLLMVLALSRRSQVISTWCFRLPKLGLYVVVISPLSTDRFSLLSGLKPDSHRKILKDYRPKTDKDR